MANCDGTWQNGAYAWKSRPGFPTFQHEISTPMLKSRGLFSKFGLFKFGFPHFQHGKMLKSSLNPCGKLICAIFYMCLNVEFPDISPAKSTDKNSFERLSIENARIPTRPTLRQRSPAAVTAQEAPCELGRTVRCRRVGLCRPMSPRRGQRYGNAIISRAVCLYSAVGTQRENFLRRRTEQLREAC